MSLGMPRSVKPTFKPNESSLLIQNASSARNGAAKYGLDCLDHRLLSDRVERASSQRVIVAPEPIGPEVAERGCCILWGSGRHDRFHHHVADDEERRGPASSLLVAVVEANAAEDVVVPTVDGLPVCTARRSPQGALRRVGIAPITGTVMRS